MGDFPTAVATAQGSAAGIIETHPGRCWQPTPLLPPPPRPQNRAAAAAGGIAAKSPTSQVVMANSGYLPPRGAASRRVSFLFRRSAGAGVSERGVAGFHRPGRQRAGFCASPLRLATEAPPPDCLRCNAALCGCQHAGVVGGRASALDRLPRLDRLLVRRLCKSSIALHPSHLAPPTPPCTDTPPHPPLAPNTHCCAGLPSLACVACSWDATAKPQPALLHAHVGHTDWVSYSAAAVAVRQCMGMDMGMEGGGGGSGNQGFDSLLVLWMEVKPQLAASLQVNDVALVGDVLLVSASSDQTLRLWQSGSPGQQLRNHPPAFSMTSRHPACICCIPDSEKTAGKLA